METFAVVYNDCPSFSFFATARFRIDPAKSMIGTVYLVPMFPELSIDNMRKRKV